ncbi:hypothetical protein Droror1_Dr00024376 [Drosera rotundifolia]
MFTLIPLFLFDSFFVDYSNSPFEFSLALLTWSNLLSFSFVLRFLSGPRLQPSLLFNPLSPPLILVVPSAFRILLRAYALTCLLPLAALPRRPSQPRQAPLLARE